MACWRGGGELLQDVAVYVADVRDARGGFIGLQRGEMRVGAAVEADHCEVEAIVCAQDAGVAFCCAAYGQARGAGC